tara:strand:- start:33 stop:293 length:261 start_codon:yes stop_codon:yes gene_type:complete
MEAISYPIKQQSIPKESYQLISKREATSAGLMNTKEIAQFIKLSPKQIGRLRNRGLPFLKIGKLVRFNPEAVLQWLQNRYSLEKKI